ncbi:endonuclease/exonuclease/phosphatase family protein [Pseudarthrobacter niigatensis]|uniref:Endonuclease/exonuclease/phosphatase family metal-dependent hydrolase n=1 Tax=Pseudarthrobacter niigatensis TaxID=369935 RepID=A0AAJ1WF71_9MICC|nr:endonuclease/exonuclease/phosphatase family protein [Pseudarthrobacter niigatensis]MDQ0144178.1 endonuclease/exonuclease/phosphatase family metal-dependent hydrolase [Pseudarthrobacter niigatensis]MDQ0266438.1 endonuclease/exonuclease/phosphatase family metal-dependent hydrolase [Pseudarthrobacter niigatensis]
MQAVQPSVPGMRPSLLRRAGSWTCWSIAAVLWLPAAGLTIVRLAGGSGTPWVQLLSLFPASLFASLAAAAAALAAVALELRGARIVLAVLATCLLLGQMSIVAPRIVPASAAPGTLFERPAHAGAAASHAGVHPLTVMALNVGSTGVDPTVLLGQARAQDVDILALPELALEGLAGLEAAGIGVDFPYRVIDVDGAGTGNAIFSRYPLVPMPRVPGTSFYQTRAVADVPGTAGGIRLTSVHVDSPRPGHTPSWRAELDQLAGLQQGLPADGSSVLLGDFNAGQDHAEFRKLLTTGLTDAAGTVGMGLVPTWPMNAPVPAFTAIDHILVSRGIRVAGFSTVGFPGTDHAAVVGILDTWP